MFKTSGRASFLIILFQFLQYYVFVVLSGDAFALFHSHFYCDSFTREDCIQNLLCTQRTFSNYWAFAVFSGPDLIANLSDGFTGVYIIFLIFAQNIDCGYSLEPPRRGGSNEYPQSMF